MPAITFCSICGSALPGPPPTTCTACGTAHFHNPKPCANAIVVEDERVLLVRRAHTPWLGSWCAPGGFCEVGEHPIETAEREVFEETGLHARVEAYVGTWVDAYADDAGEPDATVINVAYYRAFPVEGPPGAVDPAEVSEVGWFGWDEVPDDLAPPGTLASILDAVRNGAVSPCSDRPR